MHMRRDEMLVLSSYRGFFMTFTSRFSYGFLFLSLSLALSLSVFLPLLLLALPHTGSLLCELTHWLGC